MALIDKASLLMVPSTYEAGKLYNVLPSGNRAPDNKGGAGYDQTRADFDFDRGSNAAATRINSSGLIEKYRENVLLQSNNFGTTWTTSAASVTSGQSGYDSSSNAWLLNASSSATESYVRQTTSASGVDSFSIYAKAGTADQLALYIATSGADVYSWFDLTNGTTGSGANHINKTITAIENGWYRITLTGLNYDQRVDVYVANANGSFLSNSGDNILIQSAQLETGLVATDYLNSTSLTAKSGVLIDLPRINYDANGENGSLLLEPSRQQLIPFSEYFGGWEQQNVSNSANVTSSPEGLNNAYNISDNATDSRHINYLVLSGDLSLSRTFSIYAKENTLRYLFLSVTNSGDGNCYSAIFDLQSGVVSGTKTNGDATLTSSIEDAGNGWYRCIISGTMTTATGDYFPLIGTSDRADFTGTLYNDNSPFYVGNGSSIYIFGAQLEANASYQSSYIPNHGTSGGVTRAADSCTSGGSAESINSVEGVLYAEIAALINDGTQRAISIYKDSSLDNVIAIQYNSVSQNIRYLYRQGITTIADLNFVVSDITIVHKIAGSWENNNFRLFVDGVKVGEQLSGNVAPANTFITLGFNRPDGQTFFGNAKQVAVFNEALSDSELATLTTL